MKTICISLTLLLSLAFGQAQSGSGEPAKKTSTSLPKVENNAFIKGEKLKYRVHYGLIDAGTAVIEVKNEERQIAGRDVYHIVGTGKSRGAFDWFFKVRDRFETYMDEEGMFPWYFARQCDEGGYKINQNYTFYQHKEEVETQSGDVYEVPLGVQDMLSAYFYARTIDFESLSLGDTITVPSFVDNEVYPLSIRYLGIDTVKVKSGTFSCMKFCPVVQEGRIFANDEDLLVYISNDANRIPILAEAKILVGSIKMEITGWEGLANPLAEL
ncbi:MAG: DUF3108 domain-containing protein [Salibacteraceae bacterium]